MSEKENWIKLAFKENKHAIALSAITAVITAFVINMIISSTGCTVIENAVTNVDKEKVEVTCDKAFNLVDKAVHKKLDKLLAAGKINEKEMTDYKAALTDVEARLRILIVTLYDKHMEALEAKLDEKDVKSAKKEAAAEAVKDTVKEAVKEEVKKEEAK